MTNLWVSLGGVLLLIMALAGIFMYGKKSAKDEIKAKTMEDSYNAERERDKTDQDVRNMSQSESDSLRSKYSR